MKKNKIEKYAIYSKGFRGVPDGWYNILSCNFLVGENSTGKSSLLKLIEVLDSREHLLFFDLVGAVEGLETPSDICSRISGSDEVSIGYLARERGDEEKKRGPSFHGRITTYKFAKGGLELAKMSLVSGKYAIRFKRKGGDIYHRSDDFLCDMSLPHPVHCKKFLELHESSSRFKRTIKDDDRPVANGDYWFQALRQAIMDNVNKPRKGFIQLMPALNCLHYGPMRAKTRRLYYGDHSDFSPSGEHIAYVLKENLDGHPDLKGAIEKFGRDSGLFDKISISSVKTRIKDQPFALQIEKSGKYFYVDELGYGVGQVFPIIADLALTTGRNALLIEQPELHLHPRAQAALGDVFVSACAAGSTLVVETHSDFIIDRFRMKSKESDLKEAAQIIYFYKSDDGFNRASEIEIFSDGTIGDVPDGFRDFFLNESIDKIGALS